VPTFQEADLLAEEEQKYVKTNRLYLGEIPIWFYKDRENT